MVQRFDCIPELDLICLSCFDSLQDEGQVGGGSTPQFIVKSMKTNSVVYSRILSHSEKPSSIKHYKVDESNFIIYLGITNTQGKSRVTPQSGRVTPILLKYKPETEEMSFSNLDDIELKGAILDIEFLQMECGLNFIMIGVNSFISIFELGGMLDSPVA